ncbi:Uncharacterised protein [Achromobacter spanius]|uniref:hypothetical protein n=1 Tax=Achromobacter spanius TaxID=217203 RepID=UPI000C2C619D|nr:hypothetical protein [Achromobacter spanius]AUA58938.1 hypothetical protein CVS48_24775 [Achromobacter spanius]CAB3663470.1 hypothetical protein LMG5911_03094 [Achromobacter spanius]SPT40344.1 Uncharacterised protein [Achromobacter denitrificans]VEE58897.1 Uncharacterised protein [Achromobacter spanius]
MADPTFFDLFKSTWAQNGLTEGITDLQYKAGWAFIGSVPPSVEQFNKVQQTTDERLAWLYQQLDGLAAVTGRPLAATSFDALSYAQQNLDAGNLKTGTVPSARLSGTASSLTAGAAQKLATARTFSVTGGATAGAVSFDGSGNVALNVTALDLSKASAGTLPVARGGTGLATVAAGAYLTGAGAGALVARTPAQVLVDIQALPKAGGDVSGPILLGAGAGVGSQYGSNSTSGQTAHVLLPDGGGYSTHSATVTGAMKITLPPTAVDANTMIRLRVEIFESLADRPPVTILIQGYAQTSKVWGRQGATILAGAVGSDMPVRFGSDSNGALCIWLGELDKAWSYPSVTVSEVMAKYNTTGASVAGWATGWKVEPVTAFETVSQVAAVSNLAFARSDIPRVAGLQAALDARIPAVSLANLPTTNVGPILVAEVAEVWVWVSTSFYTGYRSPLCGRPLDGHTVAPLANEVDAVGGILQKSAYAALWGYAQENSLVLTQANWEARRGGHYFVNIDANTFRVPDLRDMFRRFTGTDADTANARELGSKQSDQFRSHGHAQNAATLDRSGNANAAGGTLLAVRNLGEGLTTLATGGAETRPMNAAYHPRIHA